MNLIAYFERYGTRKVADIAKLAGTNLAYLQQCKYGARRMSADLAVVLESVTDGEMTARELRPDLPWRGFSSVGAHCHWAPTSTIESAA